MSYQNCDLVIPQHYCDPCGDREAGRIRDIAFIHKDYLPADITDAADWDAISADYKRIIPGVHGEFAEGSPIEGTGYGDVKSTILGYDYAVTAYDPNYGNNCDFYDAIKNSRSWHIAFRSGTKIHISQKPVTLKVSNAIADDMNSDVVWKIIAEWQDKGLVCPHEAPEGIFVCDPN